MKKKVAGLLSLLLAVFFLFPSGSLSESSYSPKLGMTMDEFIIKYNAVPTTLDSPFKSLAMPAFWTDFDEYHVAWLYPESSSAVGLLLLSADKDNLKSTKAGLDVVQVFSLSKDSWIPLICVTKRCAGIFSEEVFSLSLDSFSIIEALKYYYENGLEKKGYTSYRSLTSDESVALSFGYSDGYYFLISSMEDAR